MHRWCTPVTRQAIPLSRSSGVRPLRLLLGLRLSKNHVWYARKNTLRRAGGLALGKQPKESPSNGNSRGGRPILNALGRRSRIHVRPLGLGSLPTFLAFVPKHVWKRRFPISGDAQRWSVRMWGLATHGWIMGQPSGRHTLSRFTEGMVAAFIVTVFTIRPFVRRVGSNVAR